MKRSPRLLASAALSVVLLPGLLAGCGSSDDTPAAAPSAAPSTPASAAAPATPSPSIETLPPQAASPSVATGAPSDTATPGPSASTGAPTAGPTASTPSGTANGVQDLGADQILARAKSAGRAAQSLHVTGDISQGSNKIGLDLRTKTTAGTGTIRNNAQSIKLTLIGSDLFIQGDESFYRSFAGGAEAAKLLRGKWLKAPKDDRRLAQLVTFFDIPKLIDSLLDPSGTLRKGREMTIEGRRAVSLTSERGGTLHVALDGEPYPLRISGQSSRSSGTIDLTDWNEQVEAQAPSAADTIDITQLPRSGN